MDRQGQARTKLCSCDATPNIRTPEDYIVTDECVTRLDPQKETTRKLSFKKPPLEPQPSVESAESVKEPYKRESSGSQVPIAGALFIATCIGSPVTALAGLKLGMFAAVGGAIMGFATGKMIEEHE